MAGQVEQYSRAGKASGIDPGGYDQLELSGRDWFPFVRRHWLLFVCSSLLGACLGLVATFLSPDRFQSNLRIYFEQFPSDQRAMPPPGSSLWPGRSNPWDPVVKSDENLRSVVVREKLADVEMMPVTKSDWLNIRLKNAKVNVRSLLESALLPKSNQRPEALTSMSLLESRATQDLARLVDVDPLGDAQLVRVSVQAASPELAHRIATSLGYVVIDEQNRKQVQKLEEERAAHGRQVVKLFSQLTKSEKALSDFIVQNDLNNFATMTARLELRIANLDFEIVRARSEKLRLRTVQAQVQNVWEQNGNLDAVEKIRDSVAIQILRRNLVEQQLKLSEVEQTGNSSQRIVELEGEISRIEGQISSEVLSIIDAIGNQITAAETVEKQMLADSSEFRRKLSALTSAATEMANLQQIVEKNRNDYETFMSAKAPEYDVQESFVPDARIQDPASWPNEALPGPYYASVTIATLAGSIVALLVALFKEKSVRGFVGLAHVRQTLRLPILMCIPDHAERETSTRNPSNPVAFRGRVSNYEDYRVLRHRLSSHYEGQAGAVILSTSIRAAEEKTDFVMDLAIAAQRDGRSVLLIDADLIGGTLSKKMGSQYCEGLTELVEEGTWELEGRNPGSGDLDVLPTGGMVDNPAACFEAANFLRFLEDARTRYDLVLIDGPPEINSLETLLLSEICDAACLVMRLNGTPRDLALQAVDQVGRDQIAGIILTGVEPASVSRKKKTGKSSLSPLSLPAE